MIAVPEPRDAAEAVDGGAVVDDRFEGHGHPPGGHGHHHDGDHVDGDDGGDRADGTSAGILQDAPLTPRSSASAPATMVVAEPHSWGIVPFGLGEPLQLGGGDRLSDPDVASRLGCEWNAELLLAVEAACTRQASAGRKWFRMDPLLLAGPEGAGRTHVARRLAHEAGVPHIPLDLSKRRGGDAFGSRSRGPTPAMPSSLAIMLAMAGCANPIVDVHGLQEADPDVVHALATAVDPMRARLDDDALGLTLDLSEVTWLIQLPTNGEVPQALEDFARVVTLTQPEEPGWPELAWIETLIEVATDRGMAGVSGAVAARLPASNGEGWRRSMQDAAERYRLATAVFVETYGPA